MPSEEPVMQMVAMAAILSHRTLAHDPAADGRIRELPVIRIPTR